MPILVVGAEGFDDGEEEGVLGDRAHCVVGDASGGCSANPGGVGEERVEATVAALTYHVSHVALEEKTTEGG